MAASVWARHQDVCTSAPAASPLNSLGRSARLLEGIPDAWSFPLGGIEDAPGDWANRAIYTGVVGPPTPPPARSSVRTAPSPSLSVECVVGRPATGSPRFRRFSDPRGNSWDRRTGTPGPCAVGQPLADMVAGGAFTSRTARRGDRIWSPPESAPRPSPSIPGACSLRPGPTRSFTAIPGPVRAVTQTDSLRHTTRWRSIGFGSRLARGSRRTRWPEPTQRATTGKFRNGGAGTTTTRQARAAALH